jgi:hypothetical protein
MSLWGFWRKKLSTFTCIFYQLSAFHFCAMCVYIKINKIIFSTHKIWVNCSCIKLHRDHIWISHKLAFLIYFVIFPNLKFKYLLRFSEDHKSNLFYDWEFKKYGLEICVWNVLFLLVYNASGSLTFQNHSQLNIKNE